MTYRHGAALPLFLLFACGSIAAQQGGLPSGNTSNLPSSIPEECSIDGRILYGNNLRAAENISVNLEQRGVIRDRNYTRGMGRFEFRGLRKDLYTVVVEAEGYRTARETVDLSYFCQNRNLTIMLEPETVVVVQNPTAPVVSARELEIPNDARKAFDKGVRELHEKQKPNKSLKHFQKAIEIHRDYDEAYVQLAVAHLEMDNTKEALKILEAAVTVYPDNARAQVLRGMLYAKQGDAEAATSALEHGVAVDDDHWLGHYELGKVLFQEKRYQEALPHAQRAHALNSQNPGVHLLLHDVCLAQQNLETALAEVKEYIELFPDADIVPRLRRHAQALEQTIAARRPQ